MQNRMLFSVVWSAVLTLATSGLAGAQTSPPAVPTAGSDRTNEVQLPVAARQKNGTPAAQLQVSDLTLLDEGKPQTIASIGRAQDQPFLVGLLVQTTRTLSGAIKAERKAAGAFVDTLFGEAGGKNELFLIHFDRQVELLQDFTASRERLRRELELMGPSPAQSRSRTEGPERMGDERQSPARAGMGQSSVPSQIYDAIFLAANELMGARQGRKALILYSDGVDSGSKVTLNDAVDAADRANLAVYTVYFKGEADRSLTSNFPSMGNGGNSRGSRFPGSGGSGYPGGQRRGDEQKSAVDGKKTLEQIARRTGGRSFEAKKKENLDEIYTQINAELHSLFWLTYKPEQADREGGFHKIVLKSNKSEIEVVTREGYYAVGR